MPDITQAMIDLYDHHTHVGLDRRALMAGLARLTGSAAAAAAVVPLLEASPAAASIVAPDDARLHSKSVNWADANGHKLSGYLVRPAGGPGGGAIKPGTVIVIHENRGLTEHIRDVARRLALAGFVALAPDLLSPAGGTPADEDKARTMIGALDRNAAVADGVTAIEYLAKLPGGNGRVGVVGFCWGGGMANALACVAGSKLAVAVAYYGPQPEAAAVPAIKAHMVLHYAGLDTRIDAGIPDYEAALKAAAVRYELYVYPRVNHAFNNDTAVGRYDKMASDLAWERTLAALNAGLNR